MIDNQQIIDIQNEYYNIIFQQYSDLIALYESGYSIEKAVETFINKTPKIFIPHYSNNQVYRLMKTYEELVKFWNCNTIACQEYITSIDNVGFFGVNDDSQIYSYKGEVRRNSLFYNAIVFNDPLFQSYKTKKNWEYNMSFLFSAVLYVYEMRRYLCDKDGEPFVLIFPFSKLLIPEEKERIMTKARINSDTWIQEMFGLSLSPDDFKEDVRILKNLSFEETRDKLLENGIFHSYAAALKYEYNFLSPKEMHSYQDKCQDIFGIVDSDGMRALFTYSITRSLATVNYSTYLQHYYLANLVGLNPIISDNEWAPIKRDLKDIMVPSDEKYMYSCAVHRNDQMGSLMHMEDKDIIELHNSLNCRRFRNLFHEATCELRKPYSNTQEIADEVFVKTDELLRKEYNDYLRKLSKNKKMAFIGLVKAGLSFVPFVSYAIAAFDIGVASINLKKSLSDKDTQIEYFGKKL